jgi:hypothetical protein
MCEPTICCVDKKEYTNQDFGDKIPDVRAKYLS